MDIQTAEHLYTEHNGCHGCIGCTAEQADEAQRRRHARVKPQEAAQDAAEGGTDTEM